LVAHAHPIPDVPVRAFFPGDGTVRVTVEVDPRCFDADPNLAQSLTVAGFKDVDAGLREKMKRQAAEIASRWVEYFFEPVGRVQPEFAFGFTLKGGDAVPDDKKEEVVVLTGEWKTTLAAGITGWRIRSTKEAKLSVVFQNIVRGKVHPRLMVLFPGESTFTLDLSGLGASVGAPVVGGGERVSTEGGASDTWATLRTFVRDGFVHVVPEGLDHILFVLGLFLLSRQWRPLFAQVTTFTLAHSVTLALAALGWVSAPGRVVEPIIAASITAVALENIWRPRYTRWRLLLVFAFGLVHGLGFASGLGAQHLPQESLVAALVGFNLGVEGGQLAVIAAALAVTALVREPAQYRRWVVVPASAAIALVGAFWAVQRLL